MSKKRPSRKTKKSPTPAPSDGKSNGIFQFKITLIDSQPPIWRRIQIPHGTLDELHAHIQTAMGWTNSHLHHFQIDRRMFGDAEFLNDGMGDLRYEDSKTTPLNEILPANEKRFRFTYEYDFGDGWQHEIVFERRLDPEAGTKYPLCLEGKRACPLEDCGGVWGYEHLLEVLADPKHEEYADMRDWIGGKFDAEKFDPKAATKSMRKGLPKWRD